MAGAEVKAAVKRKRKVAPEATKKRRRSSSQSSADNDGEDEHARILLLENSILESRKNYNNIAELLRVATKRRGEDGSDVAVVGAVSLCRVFIRLLASGALSKKKDASEKDETVARWLRERLAEYKECLVSMLGREESSLTALTLSMRTLKAESENLHSKGEYIFTGSFLTSIVLALAQPDGSVNARNEFVEEFLDQHDDIRFYTFKAIR